jgi:hypothetical protein
VRHKVKRQSKLSRTQPTEAEARGKSLEKCEHCTVQWLIPIIPATWKRWKDQFEVNLGKKN